MNKYLRRFLLARETGVLLALALLMLVFSLCTKSFLTPVNLTNTIRQSAVIGIMTMAVTFLIIAGEFDLSPGSTFAFTAIMAVVMMENHIAPGIAFIIALLLAAIIGLLNGLLVTKTRIPSFIATLGMMWIVRSITLIASGGRPRVLGDSGLLGDIMGGGMIFGKIPVPILWLLGIVFVSTIVLSRTVFGYRVYATGGNVQAAKFSGINTDRIKIVCFILVSLAAGLAGLISLCFLRMVAPVQGSGYELEAISSTVIGGTALGGGMGSILGATLGSFILAVIRNGLVLMGTSPYLQTGVLGLVMLAAVLINVRFGVESLNIRLILRKFVFKAISDKR